MDGVLGEEILMSSFETVAIARTSGGVAPMMAAGKAAHQWLASTLDSLRTFSSCLEFHDCQLVPVDGSTSPLSHWRKS